jgi:hypothetical protein
VSTRAQVASHGSATSWRPHRVGLEHFGLSPICHAFPAQLACFVWRVLCDMTVNCSEEHMFDWTRRIFFLFVFQIVAGALNASTCPSGFYCQSAFLRVPSPCPSGSFCLINTLPSPCPVGMFSSTASTTCTSCMPGTTICNVHAAYNVHDLVHFIRSI